MALADYKFNRISESNEISVIKTDSGYMCLIGDGVVCDMGSGGAIRMSTKLQAEVLGRRILSGLTGGVFLDKKENRILD